MEEFDSDGWPRLGFLSALSQTSPRADREESWGLQSRKTWNACHIASGSLTLGTKTNRRPFYSGGELNASSDQPL